MTLAEVSPSDSLNCTSKPSFSENRGERQRQRLLNKQITHEVVLSIFLHVLAFHRAVIDFCPFGFEHITSGQSSFNVTLNVTCRREQQRQQVNENHLPSRSLLQTLSHTNTMFGLQQINDSVTRIRVRVSLKANNEVFFF